MILIASVPNHCLPFTLGNSHLHFIMNLFFFYGWMGQQLASF